MSSSNFQAQIVPRVLVIDDDIAQASLLAKSLSKTVPCIAESSTDPYSALKPSALNSFDVVVTDLVMPKRDGIALLAEVKVLSPRCEVIIVTAYPQLTSAIEAMKIGAVDYLGRTGNQEEWTGRVTNSVRRALEIRSSNKSPGFHRENLIHFLLGRLNNPISESDLSSGQLLPGLALEYLIKLLLESCEGFEATYHRWRTPSEEHDIVCLNQANHAFWSRQGLIILVECKDYSKKIPGAQERGRLEEKIRNRQGQSTVGIFASTSGFAETFLRPSLKSPVPGGPPPIVIPVDREALISWVKSSNRLEWLTEHSIASIF